MAFLMETESKITETVCFLAEISKNFDKNAEQKPLFLIFRKAKVRSGPFPLAGSRYGFTSMYKPLREFGMIIYPRAEVLVCCCRITFSQSY